MKKYAIFLVFIGTIFGCSSIQQKEQIEQQNTESTFVEDSANYMVTELSVNVAFIDTGKVFEEDNYPVLKPGMSMTMPIYADSSANVKIGDTLKLCSDYGPIMTTRIDDPSIWHVEYRVGTKGFYEVDHCAALARVIITKIHSKNTVYRNNDDIITN